MGNSGCKECSERHPGCHSACPKYLEFKKRVAEERESERRIKQANRLGASLSPARKR